jgi:hypothetical protein
MAADGVRWVLTFASKNPCYRVRYLYGFLDRIVESKDSNDFLVQIRLYVVKIWKKSRRGGIDFGYDTKSDFWSG